MRHEEDCLLSGTNALTRWCYEIGIVGIYGYMNYQSRVCRNEGGTGYDAVKLGWDDM